MDGENCLAEEQWEKAARGPDGLVLSVGDEWVDGRCNTRDSGIKNNLGGPIFTAR